MDEFDIIQRYFLPADADDGVILGIGDDGAVLSPSADRDLVTVVDSMLSGVHFPPQLSPADIAFRSVAINISDIAAMGARPRWMTLALTLAEATPSWLETFARGLREAAREFDVALVGGDTTRGDQLVVTVQVTGDVETGRAIRRQGASPGDAIYVSGSPGDAACGLALLEGKALADGNAAYLKRRFSRPDARICLGRQLLSLATAAIDISDGLFGDLNKLLDASGVAGRIDLDDLPLSPELRASVDHDQALDYALGGGDDYELCFTANAGILDARSEIAGVPVTRIGEVTAGQGLSCHRSGVPFAYHDDGYRHFQHD